AQQSKLDRRVIPTAGKTPDLHVPGWTKTTLPDGAELVVSEKHNLPLVSVRINFVGGSNQFEAGNKTGLAGLVGEMLTEGTTHRTGDQISNGFQLLGTDLATSIGGETGVLQLQVTPDKFAPAIDLLADVMLNPTFPAEALDRQRSQAIVELTQTRDR